MSEIFSDEFKGDEKKVFAKLTKETKMSHGVLCFLLLCQLTIAIAFSGGSNNGG